MKSAMQVMRWQRPATMVWAGLIARELAIFIGRTYRVSPLDDHFGFGWETGRIAAAIASGHGFSSPFHLHPGSGPTALLAPIYPYLLAGVFKVFGTYTTASSIAILSLNSVFSALTVLPVFHIGKRVGGIRAAVWSGWLGAMLPYAWYWAVKWAWETSLATLLLACVFVLSLRMAGIASTDSNQIEFVARARKKDWLLFGLLWGAIALTNPALLLWLPFCGVWLLVRQSQCEHSASPMRLAIAAGVIFIAMIAPWTARNYLVFHQFIPLRGNFGTEFRMGNAEDAVGLVRYWMQPNRNPEEFERYRTMGEAAYSQEKLHEAIRFIRSHPGFFAVLSLKRAAYFWYDVPRESNDGRLLWYRNLGFLLSSILAIAGVVVMWRRRHPARFLFASLLFAIPLIYYVTYPHPRYRAPIEPEMLVLMVYLFLAAGPRNQSAAKLPASAPLRYT